MASTNPSSARLSRSTSDLSGVKRQRTSGASSRVADGGKDALPKAKIQALEQFVKFGRKAKQEKGNANQKAAGFPPPTWFQSTSSTSPSPPAAADSARETTTRGAPYLGTSSPSPPLPGTPAQHLSRTGSTTSPAPHRATPDIALSASRRATPEIGVDLSHAIGTASVAPRTSSSPTLQRRGSSFPGPETPDGDSGDAPPPEPLTLAWRIQTLLSPWSAPQAPTDPTPSATDATASSGAPRSEVADPATPDGSVPPGPVPITDSRFLAFLRNENLMGGSLDKGRQSVFAILDRLRRPSVRNMEASAGSASSSVSEREQDESDDDGDNSIMLYGPIVPSEDSEVELAASDIMSTFDDGETLEYEQPARPLSFAGAGEQLTPCSHPISLSPEPTQQEETADARQPDTVQGGSGSTGWFDTWKGKVIEGGKLVSDKVAEGTKSLKDTVVEGRKVVKTRTRWVPSPDKISFQATWWGYRLYLPPPVLDVLNNKRLEAAKRAAILTTALQWLLGQVPLTLVPPQFRVGVLIARRLVPYLGYVGGFVAWSWGAMKSFDKGHGIVLTATWLLPVALIPGSWEPNEVTDFASRNADAGARSPPGTSASDSNSTRVG